MAGLGGTAGFDACRVESLHDLRGPATRRLLALDRRDELTVAHVRVLAARLGAAERTVWRWLHQARLDGRCDRKVHTRFEITDELRVHLALLGGNASGLLRELVAAEKGWRAGNAELGDVASGHPP